MNRVGKWHSLATPSLVIGTVSSVVLGLALYYTDATDFGVSTLISLTGVTVSIGIDLLMRDVYAEVFANPAWVRNEIRRIGELSYQVSSRKWPEPVRRQLRSEYDRFLSDLEDLARGRIEAPAHENRPLLEFTRTCSVRLVGVTNIRRVTGRSRLDWWESELGRRYVQENEAALGRGVVIRRVFIYEEMDQSLRDLLALQMRAGVDVLSVHADDVPANLRRNVAIWDDRIAWEAVMDPYAAPVSNRYYFDPPDVQGFSELFSRVEISANKSGGQASPSPAAP